MRANLREAQSDLERSQSDLDRSLQRLHELEDASRELELLRRAHEAQARHLVSERLAFADQFQSEVGPLREEVAWRKGVMEEFERKLARIHGSRTYRYTAPIRWLRALLRGHRG
jgi:hypothetical protein